MKKIILALLTSILWISVSAQFEAKMEVKENIPGVCNKNEVYVLFPSFKGQVKAVCPLANDSILKRLNAEVPFIKMNRDYNDKGMINLIINCKGVLVQCKMDNKTQNPELDKQIESVFNSLGPWKAGKLKKKDVDSCCLYSFKIVNGIFTFDR